LTGPATSSKIYQRPQEIVMLARIAGLALMVAALSPLMPATAKTPARLQACLDKAGSTPETDACHTAELAILEKDLARYGDAARKVLQDEKKKRESFEAGEKAWAAYRTSYCDAIYDRWSEGTIRNAMTLGCRSNLTRDHIHAIWNDYLVTMEGEKLLPEPR
jgi:uncharacterized protein YecT (DUF1311 family)